MGGGAGDGGTKISILEVGGTHENINNQYGLRVQEYINTSWDNRTMQFFTEKNMGQLNH